ncbi:acyl carrier protein [Dactylosporangium fulvum]|uniref:Acyl carrier protein n=1 Tax=Dactylosporangium fulvum TaxID=53359 RepID=A0ABY5W8A4_9ACTN|nr:acyl carrier protein [Dactylosporangium fulvum]UWP86102.1 acyl carrier protein [Dactylosporangium fulvum]
MRTFTLDDFRSAMRSTAGVDEQVDLDGDIADVELAALGYDSLAVLEAANHISRTWQVPIPDEVVLDLATPAAVVDFVGQQLERQRLSAAEA